MSLDTHTTPAVTFGKLPRMTDPSGRGWRQPPNLRDRVRIYETHATIDEADWLALPNYETSKPTGVYAGKAWRCGRYLRWYGPVRTDKDGEYSMCVTMRALVQGPGTNLTYCRTNARSVGVTP